MKTINIKLPFFPGFYETWLENSDTEYYAIQDAVDFYSENGFETDCDDYTFDTYRRRENCIDAFIDTFYGLAPDFVLDVHKKNIVGPKNGDYNPCRGGHQDYLYCDVDFKDDFMETLIEFINNNIEWFGEKIKEDWTSYDGFMSFMENTVPEWIEQLKTEDDRYIETTLAYYMVHEDQVKEDDFVYGVLDNIYDGDYVSMKDDVYERYKQFEEEHYVDPNQTELIFDEDE